MRFQITKEFLKHMHTQCTKDYYEITMIDTIEIKHLGNGDVHIDTVLINRNIVLGNESKYKIKLRICTKLLESWIKKCGDKNVIDIELSSLAVIDIKGGFHVMDAERKREEDIIRYRKEIIRLNRALAIARGETCSLIILGRTIKESKDFKKKYHKLMNEYDYIRIASTNCKPNSLIGLNKPFYTLAGEWHLGRYAQEIRKLMEGPCQGQMVSFASLPKDRV